MHVRIMIGEKSQHCGLLIAECILQPLKKGSPQLEWPEEIYGRAKLKLTVKYGKGLHSYLGGRRSQAEGIVKN